MGSCRISVGMVHLVVHAAIRWCGIICSSSWLGIRQVRGSVCMYRMERPVAVIPLPIVPVFPRCFRHGGLACRVVQVGWLFSPSWALCLDRVVVGAACPHLFVLACPPSASLLLPASQRWSLHCLCIFVPSLLPCLGDLLLSPPASLPFVWPVPRCSVLFVVWLFLRWRRL